MTAHRYWRLNLVLETSNAFSIQALEFHTAVSGSNVATGGTASASDTYPGTSATTCFAGSGLWGTHDGTIPCWIEYDFGSGNDKDIVEVKLTARNDSFFGQTPSEFDVQYSDDGSTWFFAWRVLTSWSAGAVKSFAKPTAGAGTPHKWWGLLMYDSAGSWFSLSEFQVHSTIGGSDVFTAIGGGTASATQDAGGSNSPAKGVDGNTTTNYSSNNKASNVGLTLTYGALTTAAACAEIILIAQSGGHTPTPTNFAVIYSDDGICWLAAFSETGVTWSTDNQSQTFSNPNFAAEADYSPGTVSLSAAVFSASSAAIGNYSPGTISLSAPAYEGRVSVSTNYSPGTIAIGGDAWSAHASASPGYSPGSVTISAPTWGSGPATASYALSQITTAIGWSAHATATGNYSPGTITISAGEWEASVKAKIAEVDVAAIAVPLTPAVVAELDVAAIGVPTITNAIVAEFDIAAVAMPNTATHGGISEVDISVLTYPGPAATYRCQVWRIVRKDGQVFGFTSLDRDITWRGQLYKTCHSLSASASESAADVGSVANTELTGVLDDAGIKAADLYAGLFDDAFVDVWVIPYNDQPDDQAPFRVAAGWTGKVTRGEASFTAEVLGAGARLQQAALVDFYTPGCTHDFGVLDANGIGCPVNVDALKVVGAVVTSQALRSIVHFAATDPGGTTVWNGGHIVWTSGQNAGVSCQVDTLDWGGPAVSLWDLAPYPPAVGDTFNIFPGCPHTKAACIVYGAYLSFGGFDDVPGPDALQSNADSLFT